MQRWKYVYFSYQLTDYASDAPTLTLSYVTSPNPTAAYTSISTTGAANAKVQEYRRQITTGNKSPYLALKLAQTGPGDLQLHELALAYDPLERGALPQ
jgi:hypothetical protein